MVWKFLKSKNELVLISPFPAASGISSSFIIWSKDWSRFIMIVGGVHILS